MEIKQIADRLVELCRQGNWDQAQQELYAPTAVSIEPKGAPVERVEGMEAIIEKGKQFAEMVEKFYGVEVSDPIIAENFFSCTMSLDVEYKGMGRQAMEEICVFQVADGKIVSEIFYYTPAPMPEGM